MRKSLDHPLLDLLSQRVVVIDGAMGTSIYAHDLSLEKDYCGCENCPEVLLKLNEGAGVHSVYRPGMALADGIWASH